MPSLSVELLNCPDFTCIIITLMFGLTWTVVKVWSWSLCWLPHSCLARFLAVGIKWVLWRLRAPQSHTVISRFYRGLLKPLKPCQYIYSESFLITGMLLDTCPVSPWILLSVLHFVLTLIVQDLHAVLNLTCCLVHLKMTICNLSSNMKH